VAGVREGARFRLGAHQHVDLDLANRIGFKETIQVQGDMDAMSDQPSEDIGTAAALLVIAVVLVVLAVVGTFVGVAY
jgi:hypothetical protein